MILKWLNKKVTLIKWLVFIFSAYPGTVLIYQYQTHQLGINGLETLTRTTGYCALILFIITLAITPLRRTLSYLMILIYTQYGKRLGDWNWLIKCRRLVGVLSFIYALVHFLIFFYFELDFEISEFKYEIEEKPFIIFGFTALSMLLLLFLTSTNASMRLLKKNWRRLHRLMYPTAACIAAHYLTLTKPGVYDAYPYAILIILLLVFRVLDYFNWVFNRKDDGMVAER